MNKIFTTACLALMVIFFASTGRALASASDTLVVFANDSKTLDQTILSDTTLSGSRIHKAYKLVSLDTTYIYTGAITVNSNITVVGVRGSNGRPPCIQPGVLQSGGMPTICFVLNKNGITGTFKDLYIFGKNIADDWNWGKFCSVTADSVKFYLDNSIIEENRGEIVSYTGKADNFYITNSKFKNGVYPTDWFSTTIVGAAWPTSNPADTIIMKNNTIFCLNSYAAAPGQTLPLKYLEFTHNSIIYNFVEPLIIFTVLQAKINDNLFYGLFAGAETKSEYPWWHQTFSADIGSIISIDTIQAKQDTVLFPGDAGRSDFRMYEESKRTIEVKNNVFFQPKALTDFWATWNDTAHVDTLITPLWMNNRTKSMFANKTSWPGFNETGNILDTDPGFGTSVQNVLTNSGNSGVVSLLKYVTEIRTATETTDIWGYNNQTVAGDNWIPAWPLSEAADMKYSNKVLQTAATDGKPVGDYSWFGTISAVKETSSQVPSTFSLSNAYPNPFNPTTNIKFSIAKNENVKLMVFNVLGQKIKTLVNGEMKAGSYNATWNGKDESGVNVASGIYFYKLESQSFNSTKKMILMK
jgi:hypothetical protein